jgi:hypothetical protein
VKLVIIVVVVQWYRAAWWKENKNWVIAKAREWEQDCAEVSQKRE